MKNWYNINEWWINLKNVTGFKKNIKEIKFWFVNGSNMEIPFDESDECDEAFDAIEKYLTYDDGK
jgi:hypothetical protein